MLRVANVLLGEECARHTLFGIKNCQDMKEIEIYPITIRELSIQAKSYRRKPNLPPFQLNLWKLETTTVKSQTTDTQ